MPKEPKISSLHIFAISSEKPRVWIDFLPANRHKSILQVDSFILGVGGQACPKYQKQLVYYIFAISRKTLKLYFLPAHKRLRFLKIDTIILGVCDDAFLNYP